ncbi:cation-transporting P-type ATPase [Sinomicrobium pectinilyticum]|uniref:Cation-transporting P-type ATPase n=1 Tax=Sinomicrobium pectinilyticum TaxID=1084421 RepID=A0A3N0F3G2_SINP1|nr:cation-transporting P-type ATPase [Sinomicrobium pectinilyticum]RNL94522.1 cation-transporting P-type ATPase [Sinomicrobium pectinilyticum]
MQNGTGTHIENVYLKSAEEVLEAVSVDSNKGLTDKDIEERFRKYGRNILEKQEDNSIWKILLSQINNPVIYLLSAASVLAFIFGDIAEGITIVIVLLINTGIGFWMEYKAQKSMKTLKELDRIEARVLRNGKEEKIDAEKIVPGDILIVEAGDLIAADARILEKNELEVDESPLTGESVPVKKSSAALMEEKPVADRNNILYKGTAVSGGTGKAVVYATGMQTVLGSISAMVGEEKKDEIPLNKKLNKLVKNLIYITIGLAVVFLVIGWIAGEEHYSLIQTSIAWTIAAIPEGLPIVASIALARGMLRLAKKNVIVKKLEAVETLGETGIIFTDKTGTLTMNQLTVSTLYLPGDLRMKAEWQNAKPTIQEQQDPEKNENFLHVFKISALANDARLEEGENEKGEGDPLEIALLDFTQKLNPDLYRKIRGLERKLHDPFDSGTMVMGAVYRENEGFYVAAKGAAHAIFDRSDKILTGEEVKDFTDKEKEYWHKKNDELSEEGFRVLAFSYRNTDILPEGEEAEDFIRGMVFAGLIGFIDPPRKEVADAINTCKNAGIKVMMVTGDHPGTAKNVGEQVGLYDREEKSGNGVLSGQKLGEELEKEDDSRLFTGSIFSRVDPAQKLELIKHFQKNGEIVGMTGDGINDAPALKRANIGIAMGKRGTQVAQEVSDMVLKDDAFGSIVKAIEQGRIIFGNIRKFIIYQLSYHLSEILIIALISFTLFTLPLLPLQLLFLNLLSDVFPALALGVGEGNPGIMKKPPKDPEEPILTKKNWARIALYGVIFTICISGAYFFAHFVWDQPEEITNNIAFFSLAFAQLLHVFNMREADEHILNNQVTRNNYIWMALGLCFSILIAAYFIPAIADVLSLRKLEPRIWGLIIITSLLPLLIIQAGKLMRKNF